MSDNFDLNFQDPQQEQPEQSTLAKIAAGIALIFAPLNFILSFLPRKVRIIVIISLVTSLFVVFLMATQPRAEKRPIPETVVTVEVIEANRVDYPIIVNANGTIQADIRGDLVSQIRGEIVAMSESFKNGGAFNEGDILIEVDQRDYLAEVSQALSAVSQARAALQQEQALAKQAQTDWERLGNVGKPPALVARQPQVAAARAQLESASARYETAKLNLERTKIKAPYTGRVILRNAVLGQYVGVGTRLAEIFSTDAVEVRLPVSQAEYTQLGLDRLNTADAPEFKVQLSSQLGAETFYWDARVTRTDSTFDLATRQIDVIAEVIEPFSTENNKPPLKIGQFVNASIEGRQLESVIAVPNKALREGNYVFTSQDEVLVRTPVVVAWQDDKNSVISQGLNVGDIVVTTSLNSTLAGAKVKYSEQPASLVAPQVIDPTQAGDGDLQATSSLEQPAVLQPNGLSLNDEQTEADAPVDAGVSEASDTVVEELLSEPDRLVGNQLADGQPQESEKQGYKTQEHKSQEPEPLQDEPSSD